MIDPADIRFFRAVLDVLAPRGAQDDARTTCRTAIETALASADPQDLRAARLSIDALPLDEQAQLMQQVHARMAGDLASIWDFLPGAPQTGKPN